MKRKLPKESSCDCAQCKAMCGRFPCRGNPREMARLDLKRLRVSPVTLGSGIMLLQPRGAQDHLDSHHYHGKCTFQDAEGHCTLHKAGLKPWEGRVATCKPINVTLTGWECNQRLERQWNTKTGRALVARWEEENAA